METTGTREEQTTELCRILAMPVKHWFFILALVLIFMALCVVVFAGEPGAPSCDLQSGLAATLNLSQKQCEDLRQLTDRFYNDTAVTRNKIVEKRLELRNPLKTSETEPHVINKRERELKALDQEFSRRAHQTEVDQRRLLSSDQIHKIKEMTYGYNLQRSGRRGYERQ